MIKLSIPRYVSLYPVLSLLGACASKSDPTCNSQIYCKGLLLHTVQLARFFPDSKTFVDLKLSSTEGDVLACFHRLMNATGNSPGRHQLMSFLDLHFEEKEELYYWRPPDFQEHPPFLNKIKNLNLSLFAKDIISIWPTLGRKVSPDVAWSSKQYSFIYVPNGFIVPGGRFKELYYWDSYWIIRGLLISNMMQTAKGMIENFLYLVRRFDYVPNGSRIYYLGRSQPPLLTWMVTDYFAATGDKKWLKYNIMVLEKELNYWLENKTLIFENDGVEYKFLHYSSDPNSSGPRPESYYEDYMNGKKVPRSMREAFYAEIRAGAESGWDFSSRWIINDEINTEFDITDINTSRIIPVDLNSIFAGALQKLGDLWSQLRDSKMAEKWWRLAKQWRYSINKFMWDPEDGVWYDFDSFTMTRISKFYLSCAAPLWAGAVDSDKAPEQARRFAGYLQSTNLLKYHGGVPTSLWHTGEQWDFPNAWAPLQSMLIGGLQNSNCSQAKKLARKFAKTWYQANYFGFMKSQKLFEKYSSINTGDHGGGGEYEVQDGFGWTNGVLLDLIQTYGETLL